MGQANVVHPVFGRPLGEVPEESWTLPARFYTDPAIYEQEKEKIFFRSWIFIGHASQVARPGDYVTGSVCDQGVFAIRGRDGALRAFYNVCQHRAHELLSGSGNLKAVITCPYHAWAYGLDGALRNARNCEHVKGFDKADFTLPQVRVEEFCNLVFVNLDPDARPLAEQAPNLEADIRQYVPGFDELRPVEVQDFGTGVMKAGWKVVVDNYVECYHCGPAHPAFADMIDMPSYENDIDGITARQLGPNTRGDSSAYHYGDDAPVQRSAFWYLWPTTTINVLPGDKVNLYVTQIVPVGPDTARFVNYRLAHEDQPEPKDRYDYVYGVLSIEDQDLCESVQRGLRSKAYDQGRFVAPGRGGEDEHVLHHFHRLVKDALEG